MIIFVARNSNTVLSEKSWKRKRIPPRPAKRSSQRKPILILSASAIHVRLASIASIASWPVTNQRTGSMSPVSTCIIPRCRASIAQSTATTSLSACPSASTRSITTCRVASSVPRAIKNHLIHVYSRKRYYEYHNGTRPLTPDVERYVRQTIVNCGWSQEPQFSGYVEEFLW